MAPILVTCTCHSCQSKPVCNDLSPEFTVLCPETLCVLDILEMQGPSKSREDCTVFGSKLYQDLFAILKNHAVPLLIIESP